MKKLSLHGLSQLPDSANQASTSLKISVVGAGLAGSECAYQLAQLGFKVQLFEMRVENKPESFSPAHKTSDFAELVCSNSFGSFSHVSAPGQLKWEMAQLGSLILESALQSRVPAGQALSMDRKVFSEYITQKVKTHPNIEISNHEVKSLNEIPRPCVVATGPLTSAELSSSLKEHFGNDFLYFYDAIAPIVAADSINTEIAWKADRWDKGTKDYFNCPFSKDEYFAFIDAIENSRKIESKEFEKDVPYFEGCMPIEAMVERGRLTPRFGPMKAVGLRNPKTDRTPFAVVQLRQDNREATAFNIVGFQTKMSYGDQARVFRMIPGLEQAEFLKLGSIHRNLFINTPKCLNLDLSSKKDPDLFFAGQITGVEGYFESTSVGLLVAHILNLKYQKNIDCTQSEWSHYMPPRASALGSLLNAITDETKVDHFQPTNINFALLPSIEEKMPKPDRKLKQISIAQQSMESFIVSYKAQLSTEINTSPQLLSQLAQGLNSPELSL